MAQTLKSISDAVIGKIALLSGFSAVSVAAYNGDLDRLLERGPVLPYCGVQLTAGEYSRHGTDSLNPREGLSAQLTLLVQDYRDTANRVETGYGLVDTLITGLNGAALGLSGVAPLQIESWSQDQDLENMGSLIYTIRFSTWQVR